MAWAQRAAVVVVAVGAVALSAALVLRDDAPAPRKRWAHLETRPWESERFATQREESQPAPYDALVSQHTAKRRPEPGDWLADHEERGESYAEWAASEPVRATGERRTIYLQPFGDLRADQQAAVAKTAQYVALYFGLPVTTLPTVPANALPGDARRLHPRTGERQLWTWPVLEYLHARRPEDAVALIALTGEDLYPDENWNFVFGQAHLRARVGVWSLHRLCDAEAGDEGKRLCLRRTVATAVHELGHMLSMHHCVAWECVMNGINHQAEADRVPLEPCPACLAKLCDATSCDLPKRFTGLRAFWKENGGAEGTVRYLEAALERVERRPSP